MQEAGGGERAREYRKGGLQKENSGEKPDNMEGEIKGGGKINIKMEVIPETLLRTGCGAEGSHGGQAAKRKGKRVWETGCKNTKNWENMEVGERNKRETRGMGKRGVTSELKRGWWSCKQRKGLATKIRKRVVGVGGSGSAGEWCAKKRKMGRGRCECSKTYTTVRREAVLSERKRKYDQTEVDLKGGLETRCQKCARDGREGGLWSKDPLN